MTLPAVEPAPALTHAIALQYTLMKDVAASLKKPKSVAKQFLNPPLVRLVALLTPPASPVSYAGTFIRSWC
jgi:hypothetical protein